MFDLREFRALISRWRVRDMNSIRVSEPQSPEGYSSYNARGAPSPNRGAQMRITAADSSPGEKSRSPVERLDGKSDSGHDGSRAL